MQLVFGRASVWGGRDKHFGGGLRKKRKNIFCKRKHQLKKELLANGAGGSVVGIPAGKFGFPDVRKRYAGCESKKNPFRDKDVCGGMEGRERGERGERVGGLFKEEGLA